MTDRMTEGLTEGMTEGITAGITRIWKNGVELGRFVSALSKTLLTELTVSVIVTVQTEMIKVTVCCEMQ